MLKELNIARYVFIALAIASILSIGWFGIPLIPEYLVHNKVNTESWIFTVFSALGTVWGVMAYREFTKSIDIILETRMTARKLDSRIGGYEYRTYNPVTRDYEEGLPLGQSICGKRKRRCQHGWTRANTGISCLAFKVEARRSN